MKNVLVVDDEPNIANLLKLILRERYKVETAYSAIEAHELLKTFKPDVIALDIMMPGKDGITFAKELSNEDNYKDIPIIFITAKTDIQTREKALDIGSVAFIEKPFKSDEVLSTIDLVIGENKS
jgi:DNA-binding response OmpR family regulator